ncbi:peptidoglycan D,D-transpeptidase FtsI family protein [Teichococcus aestuarii]|uniref:Penicillin-binding protein n=2 Tax=Teichococcus aestuarii TaxID=568898 RepID=A0A2U1V6I0_9PROT|nr:penicillin-binding protein 2 [Pseudoroseomonas aestuarii]PWC29502.1 penicillin-binding protein [Pseudoroseomonas aestuarii]
MPHVPPPSPDSPPLRHPRQAPVGHEEPAPPAPGVVVRVTQPDLARRAQLERSRGRLVIAALGFGTLFLAVAAKATWSTVVMPAEPKRLNAAVRALQPPAQHAASRAPITDRNGEMLAISLPVTALIANPRVIENKEHVADRIRTVLPQIERDRLIERLSGDRGFVYVARALTPREQQGIINLGIAGLDFEEAERRYYPQGRAAVHVLGNVDVDGNGLSGIERRFDERLRTERDTPLKLSIDVRVQLALRDAVSQAISDFSGIGGAGVVLDINTAEVVAMVSLPDYDAGDIGGATPDQRFNRATVGVYEPGSTFKLFTAAAALEYGTANVNTSSFDASRPIRYGRFTISDYKGKNRWITFPEMLAYSSNLGAAHMAATFGPARQREFLKRAGMLARTPIELPEAAAPLVPPANSWRDINMFTISFGHGISVTPLHVVTGVSAIANGGILRAPTLLAQPPGTVREGTRLISEQNSETMRRLMRLVVTDGSGKNAEVPGYFVGGKTGTAQKTGPRGGYIMNKRIAAFVGAFPMQAPRYALYVMVDEPTPNAKSHGYATAGWVAAPAAHTVISRIAPILGLVPEDPANPAIVAATEIPLQPGRPRAATASARAAAPAVSPAASRPAEPPRASAPRPAAAPEAPALRAPQPGPAPVQPRPLPRAVPMPNMPASPGSLPPPVPLRMTSADPSAPVPRREASLATR